MMNTPPRELRTTWSERLGARAQSALRRIEGCRAPRSHATSGFTLLEIMIVLAIMGLIVTGVSIKVFSQLKKAKISTAKMGVSKVTAAAGRFMAGPGASCPKGIEELISQGELSKSDIKDPWGTAYVFRCPGTQDTDGVDVYSWGPDKIDGNADDVRSWENQ